MIGAVKGFAEKATVEIGENIRKFGRTTGFTAGKIFSVYLDIWIKYDRTGQSSFFKNQFLIEPEKPQYEKFVEKGDSGSFLVDAENFATGLIFAGANGNLEGQKTEKQEKFRQTGEQLRRGKSVRRRFIETRNRTRHLIFRKFYDFTKKQN